MMEIWKDIENTKYAVSNLGRVKNKADNIILKPDRSSGYERVTIYKGKEKTRDFVHRLVAKYFIPNEENKPFIDHIDTNSLNNRFDNLRWVTQKENINNPISLKKRNKPHSKEWCENISKALQKKPILCVEKNEIYLGQMDAQRQLGVPQANIHKVLYGERKTAGGYHWQYI